MGVKVKLTIFVLLIIGIMVPKFISAEVLAEDTKYYKTVYRDNLFGTYSVRGTSDVENIEITKEEYDAFNPATNVQPTGSSVIETTYKRMTTTINKINGEFVYKNNLSWKNFPATRSYDIISISHPSSVKIASMMQFTTQYCDQYGNCYSNSSHNPIFSSSGVGTIFPLPTGNLNMLNHTLSFTVEKNTTATIYEQSAVGDYAHATEPVALSSVFDAYPVFASGIVLPAGMDSSYDTFNTTEASWIEAW